MARSDTSDLEWEFIKAVLPGKSRGVKRVDDRRVINGITYGIYSAGISDEQKRGIIDQIRLPSC